jgi:hypothetical protein
MTKGEAAHALVAWHFDHEPDLSHVIRFLGDDEMNESEPIKLLEVNGATIATGRVDVYTFAASDSDPFPVAIAEVTPAEYERIRVHDPTIPLPRDWSLDCAQEIRRF